MKEILLCYERVSSQVIINIEKSKTTFSLNVNRRTRRKIQRIIGLVACQPHGKYLRVLIFVGKIKEQPSI